VEMEYGLHWFDFGVLLGGRLDAVSDAGGAACR
jgi:hypothetical protein